MCLVVCLVGCDYVLLFFVLNGVLLSLLLCLRRI